MSAPRIIAVLAILVGVGIYALASSADNQEAYLFPRLTGVGMIVCAVALLIEKITQPLVLDKVKLVPWLTVAPALAIFAAYIYVAEDLGFYASAFVAFFALVSIYAPERRLLAGWIKRFTVSVLFITAMYSIFSLLLKVQTPRGILI